MARRTHISILVLALLALAGAALAAETPVTVSPGNPSKLVLVDGRCPAFSWAGGEGAKSYELVVYRVGEEGEEAEPVLRQDLPAPAYSWTPSLDRCLERGGQYAWSVRAVGPRMASEWSAPNLFEVASGPSAVEFEEAVEVVRQYLAEEETGSVRVSASSGAQRTSSSLSAPKVRDVPAPLSGVAGDSALQVNGSAVVTTATFGAGLCEALTYRYVDQGDGTVLDCNTGLIWLKDANCATLGPNGDGTADWFEAQAAAAALADGTCGLTDGSQAGEWRLPEIGEFCSRDSPTPIGGVCPSANASDSLVNSAFSDPSVGNAAGDGQWAGDDAFVGVQFFGLIYWSATEIGGSTAWGANLSNGLVDGHSDTDTNYVWPVRSGQ